MTLTNYWWLLIWLVGAGWILAYFFPKHEIEVLGKTEYRWGWTPAIVLAFPYILWAMNRRGIGDTEVYRTVFHDVPSSIIMLPTYLEENTKDKGYSIFTTVLKQFIGEDDKLFFLIIAVIQFFCIVYFFRKYSNNFMLCMFMFVASTDYISWVFNGMRQFLAVCIMLFAFESVLKKKYVCAILIILIAATIHGSALLMLPLIFVIQGRAWNAKTLLLMLAVGLVVLYIDEFTLVLENMLTDTQYNDMIGNEIWSTDDGTNLLRVLFYSIPAILSLIGKRYVDEANSSLVNMCVNCSICTTMIYLLSAFSSGIYIGRLPIMFTLQGYAVVPWLIENTFTRDSARLITWGLIAGFISFFYIQMHFGWGIM